MGADCYETDSEREQNRARGIPDIGIGENCTIRRAIIDKNARIGKGVSIGQETIPEDGDYGEFHVVDGVYVITKNACIPDGSVL